NPPSAREITADDIAKGNLTRLTGGPKRQAELDLISRQLLVKRKSWKLGVPDLKSANGKRAVALFVSDQGVASGMLDFAYAGFKSRQAVLENWASIYFEERANEIRHGLRAITDPKELLRLGDELHSRTSKDASQISILIRSQVEKLWPQKEIDAAIASLI